MYSLRLHPSPLNTSQTMLYLQNLWLQLHRDLSLAGIGGNWTIVELLKKGSILL